MHSYGAVSRVLKFALCEGKRRSHDLIVKKERFTIASKPSKN